jgi:hypothetical protein
MLQKLTIYNCSPISFNYSRFVHLELEVIKTTEIILALLVHSHLVFNINRTSTEGV